MNGRIVVTTIAVLLAACAPKHREDDAGVAAADCGSTALRETITRFGRQLRQVSLLAPDSIRIREMRPAYAPYVTDSLLQSWIASPGVAPGRETSSPWPARIDVRSVEPLARACRVHGAVVYVTSSDSSGADTGLRRSVTLDVVPQDGGWRVNRFAQALPPREPAAVDSATDMVMVRQALERYYQLINGGNYRDAYLLWGDSGRSSRQSFEAFRAGFAHTRHVDLTVGAPGRVEGAAGSRFVEVPVTISAVSDDGTSQRYEGTYTLRRVVVEGATALQRRWHLYSAEVHRVR